MVFLRLILHEGDEARSVYVGVQQEVAFSLCFKAGAHRSLTAVIAAVSMHFEATQHYVQRDALLEVPAAMLSKEPVPATQIHAIRTARWKTGYCGRPAPSLRPVQKRVLVRIRGQGRCPKLVSRKHLVDEGSNTQAYVGDDICSAQQDFILALDCIGSLKEGGFLISYVHVLYQLCS